MDMNQALKYAESRGIIIQKLETDVASLKSEKEQLKAKLQAVQSEKDCVIRRLEEQLKATSKEKKQLTGTLIASRRKEEQLREEVKSLEDDKLALRHALELSEQGELTGLEELQQIKASRDELKQLLEAVKVEHTPQDEVISQLKNDLTSLKEELNIAQRSLQESLLAQRAAEHEVESLRPLMSNNDVTMPETSDLVPPSTTDQAVDANMLNEHDGDLPAEVHNDLPSSSKPENEALNQHDEEDTIDLDYENSLFSSDSDADMIQTSKEAVSKLARTINKRALIALTVMMEAGPMSAGIDCTQVRAAGKRLFDLDYHQHGTWSPLSHLYQQGVLTKPGIGIYKIHPDWAGENLFAHQKYGKLRRLYELRRGCDGEFELPRIPSTAISASLKPKWRKNGR
ncbi:hypothetical protein HDV00_004998 [Rhizophlyctis rosea]|nr:hypothetical protein HDV00_004998 [Rhizophlyctis rosea]